MRSNWAKAVLLIMVSIMATDHNSAGEEEKRDGLVLGWNLEARRMNLGGGICCIRVDALSHRKHGAAGIDLRAKPATDTKAGCRMPDARRHCFSTTLLSQPTALIRAQLK
jgi:hypothetical protein